jgi:three-Cys-motif partner protein
MNQFGGNWTYQKIKIVEEYAKAYLQIMKNFPYYKLMYFDGFAGSGGITIGDKMDENSIDGAAKVILEIVEPKPFDTYYFVELGAKKAALLKESLDKIKTSGVFVVSDDCNKKMIDMANYLRGRNGKSYKVLAFIDPCGMNVDWSSIEYLKGLGIDMWILVPTGLGANRLLMKDGNNIPESWFIKLEKFFGINKELILQCTHTEVIETDLFGDTKRKLVKNDKGIKEVQRLYSQRLKSVFKYVSNPYVMRNSQNSTMFHLFLASNNSTAVNIANDIVRKYNQMY